MNFVEHVLNYPSWFFPIGFTLMGTCIGSFLNVCMDRIPKGQSVVSPRSRCSCGCPVAGYDNIPILSWFFLRGKARCCGIALSRRYPLVEGLTGMIFLLNWLFLPPLLALIGMFFCSMLIAATWIDFEHMLIPDCFSIGLAVSGVGLSFILPELHGYGDRLFLLGSLCSGITSIVGLVVGAGVILWIAVLAEMVLKTEAVGFGDVKFLGGIGAFCGWQGALFALFGGAVIGMVIILPMMLYQHFFSGTGQAPREKAKPGETEEISTEQGDPIHPTEKLGARVPIPFGPMLALGALIYFIFLSERIDAYFLPFQGLFD